MRLSAGARLAVPLLLAVPWLSAVPAPAPPVPLASPPATASDTVVLEDDLGRTVRLGGPAERIVSLVPAATELLFALGAGERVVGRTRYGTRPPAAAEVPSVGPGLRPSLELVVGRDPDAVVLYAAAGQRATVDRLEGLGIAALAVRHDAFGDLYRNLERLGRLTGRAPAARRLEKAVRCRLRAVATVTGEVPARDVYYEVWSDPPITVGAGSYLDSLLVVAGARNVFADLQPPSPQVSLESVVARAPDLILVPRRSAGEASTPPARRPGWRALEAVREGRVREVDGDLVHRLGPRVGEAAAALARTVHPRLASRLTEEALAAACGPPPAERGTASLPSASGARGRASGPLAGARPAVVPPRRGS